MKRIISNVLVVAFLCFGSCCIATAQGTGVAQSDQITLGGEIIQADGSTTGSFEPVDVDALTTSGITLQFPTSLANKSVAIEALDGGTLSSTPTAIDANGNLSFSFQVTDQPGVHRVIVIDPNADADSLHIIGVVQIEVPPPAE
jgi:hypothetical protein